MLNNMQTLQERIEPIMETKGWDIATTARTAGVSHSAVSQWLGKGTKPIVKINNAEAASKLAKETGLNALWIATGKGPKTGFNLANLQYTGSLQKPEEAAAGGVVVIDLDQNPDYPAIRRVKVKAQAGVSGYAVEYVDEDGPPIVFRADWYKSKGFRPDRMLALRVKGESMIPSLYEGDLIVVNTEQHTPKQGVPYLVSYEGEVVVKRLVRDDGIWWLVSDNPDQRRYPRTKCNTDTQIIGEVVYRQTERI